VENLASLIRLVLLTVDGQTYALHLETVGRILRMAEITPLPGVPDAAEGVVDVQAKWSRARSCTACRGLRSSSMRQRSYCRRNKFPQC